MTAWASYYFLILISFLGAGSSFQGFSELSWNSYITIFSLVLLKLSPSGLCYLYLQSLSLGKWLKTVCNPKKLEHQTSEKYIQHILIMFTRSPVSLCHWLSLFKSVRLC